MPVVHVHIWEGYGEETAETLIRGITRVFEDLGSPAENVTVLIHEMPKTHWGKGGKPSSKKGPDSA